MPNIRTQRAQIYFVTAPTVATEIQQNAGFTGVLAGARDQIDTTHLMSDEREFEGGFNNPGPITIQLIWDTALASHAALNTLRASGARVPFMVCDSDGTTVPTVVSSAFGAFATRTNHRFIGYVADIALDYALNEVVRATVTIQRSGPTTTTPRV